MRRARVHESTTPGGARLRALRERAGKTQLWVEAAAELGSGYLQRVECGRVARPECATLDRILTALNARYSARREILETYGYRVDTAPPSVAEITWARAVSRSTLDEVAFPAYVLDCTHCLIAWNRFVPRLFGLPPHDPTLGGLAGQSLLAPWFDPASPLSALVTEPDRFLPALIRAFRDEMQLFNTEPWYPPLLGQLWRDLPRFRHFWQVVDQQPSPVSAARALAPVRLAVPGAGILEFRLASEHFTEDARFRLVYFLPADPAAMNQCAAWNTREGR